MDWVTELQIPVPKPALNWTPLFIGGRQGFPFWRVEGLLSTRGVNTVGTSGGKLGDWEVTSVFRARHLLVKHDDPCSNTRTYGKVAENQLSRVTL